MATGSKCLAEKQLPLNGSLIHDSHAEILARRCFQRYIYSEMKQLIENEKFSSEIIEIDREMLNSISSNNLTADNYKNFKIFSIKNNYDFILFSSHTPCGDASIIPKNDDHICLKRQASNEKLKNESKSNKKIRLEDEKNDIHRTGAKCVPNSLIQDPKEKGENYHVTGVIRLKPGRGDPTLSMSCSDKIAKWIVLGIQGSLLDIFLKSPIYLKAIVIGKCPFNLECMKRALIFRSIGVKNIKYDPPEIFQSSLIFKDSKLAKTPNDRKFNDNLDDDDEDLKASFNSLCWTHGVQNKQFFVLVKGSLQGVTKSSKKPIYPPISKHNFLENFKNLYSKITICDYSSIKYIDLKKKSYDYLKGLIEFHSIYRDWVRIDQNKFYLF